MFRIRGMKRSTVSGKQKYVIQKWLFFTPLCYQCCVFRTQRIVFLPVYVVFPQLDLYINSKQEG